MGGAVKAVDKQFDETALPVITPDRRARAPDDIHGVPLGVMGPGKNRQSVADQTDHHRHLAQGTRVIVGVNVGVIPFLYQFNSLYSVAYNNLLGSHRLRHFFM